MVECNSGSYEECEGEHINGVQLIWETEPSSYLENNLEEH